ncbi:hypothetical protein DPMN_090361 [Dreissena polymorpha]|uniref:Uncharacterized protein n=1 Tax=Dreissena polymorpha TaxID=45954 RepID=A0A9D4QY94_DREPO|nr:hypothetical protein DPMN_090361 [Dreissena polymorpha]
MVTHLGASLSILNSDVCPPPQSDVFTQPQSVTVQNVQKPRGRPSVKSTSTATASQKKSRSASARGPRKPAKCPPKTTPAIEGQSEDSAHA